VSQISLQPNHAFLTLFLELLHKGPHTFIAIAHQPLDFCFHFSSNHERQAGLGPTGFAMVSGFMTNPACWVPITTFLERLLPLYVMYPEMLPFAGRVRPMMHSRQRCVTVEATMELNKKLQSKTASRHHERGLYLRASRRVPASHRYIGPLKYCSQTFYKFE